MKISATVPVDAEKSKKRLSCSPLVVVFWMSAFIAVAVLAYVGSVGWDARIYWSAIQSLHGGVSPYAEGIARQQAFQRALASGSAQKMPFTYVYSPLTLPLLRLLGRFPGRLLGVLYGAAVLAGFLLQIWSGVQMAAEQERRWLALMLPAVAFFPGLITDDVILSGNVAYILYGLILAAAVPGWKRGNWFWYYLAVLGASICKVPLLTLLAFPVLAGRRQWIPAGLAGSAGLLLFAGQSWLWPDLFREYLLAVRLQFDYNHDFGFSLPGTIGRLLWHMGKSYSPATTISYLVFASIVGFLLLALARRFRLEMSTQETWLPVALLGTFLLSPRIMKYDLAAMTVPMLLIGGRTLRYISMHTSNNARNHIYLGPALVGSVCFLVPNAVSVAGSQWPVELAMLLIVFVMGLWLLQQRGSGHRGISQSTAAPEEEPCGITV